MGQFLCFFQVLLRLPESVFEETHTRYVKLPWLGATKFHLLPLVSLATHCINEAEALLDGWMDVVFLLEGGEERGPEGAFFPRKKAAPLLLRARSIEMIVLSLLLERFILIFIICRLDHAICKYIYICVCIYFIIWVNVTTGYTLVKTRHSRVPINTYSVKRTQLIGRRALLPCRVRKTAGYTLSRLRFPRTVPRFSEMYPDLTGS